MKLGVLYVSNCITDREGFDLSRWLPPEAVVEASSPDLRFEYNETVFRISHPAIPGTAEGCPLPRINVVISDGLMSWSVGTISLGTTFIGKQSVEGRSEPHDWKGEGF